MQVWLRLAASEGFYNLNATRPRDWSDSFIFNLYSANVHS